MIEINLLPKELQSKRFGFSIDKNVIFIIIGGLVITSILVVYSFVFQVNKISGLEAEIKQAQEETARYAEEIQRIEEISLKKKQILARMSAIQLLDQNRSYWVKLLEDLIRRVPDYVWLSNIEQNPMVGSTKPGQTKVVTKSVIEGYSFSVNAFATFLVRLKKSDMFSNIEITSIKLQETEEAKAYSFSLICNFAMPELPVAAAETAQSAPAAGTQF